MKALRFHGAGDLRLDVIDEPTCGNNQVKLKPEFVGLCGTDLHEYLEGPIIIPSTPHPLTGEKIPVTLGHEFSATVVEVGSEFSDLQTGDKVAVFPMLSDSTCPSCRRGMPNCCSSSGSIGFSGPGGLSEYIVVPRENVFKLPSNITLEEGALAEPLSVAWHAVNNSPFQKGDDALVIGAGPVGLAVVQVLKARGAGEILVSEVSARRQELARHFGASHVFDPKTADVVSKCKEACGGDGPGVVFDAAGVQPGLDLAFAASRSGATIVNIATWKTLPEINSILLILGEKRYVGTMVFLKEDFAQVIEAMGAGALQPKAMISSVIPLEETIEKGFKQLLADKDSLVKVLVQVQNS